ncbi:MAG: hypothetical protein ICV79_29245 [Flavisolibacter sp.]|nr:hypothetical protein [Flavisolibacter sp.]
MTTGRLPALLPGSSAADTGYIVYNGAFATVRTSRTKVRELKCGAW